LTELGKTIKVYGKAGCSRCEMVKQILAKKNIQYEYFLLDDLPYQEKEEVLTLAKLANEKMILPIILKENKSMFVSEL
jgi:glutaredoxin